MAHYVDCQECQRMRVEEGGNDTNQATKQGVAAVPSLQCVYTHRISSTGELPWSPTLSVPPCAYLASERQCGPVDFIRPDRASSQPI